MPRRQTMKEFKEFTPLENACVDHFMVLNNQTAAYIKARGGKKPKQASRCASSIFNRPHIKAEVERRQKAMADKCEVTAERVIAELAKIGFANIGDYVSLDAKGTPHVDLSTMTRDQAAALSEITVDEYMDGKGEEAREVRKVKVKLCDKRQALVDLGKHLGLFAERVTLNLGDEALALIFAAMPQEMADAVKKSLAERLKKQEG